MSFKGLSDEQWSLIEGLMQWKPTVKVRGKPRTHFRYVWNTLFWLLVTGCRWAEIPKKPDFAARTSAHRWMMNWKAQGIYERVLNGLLLKATSEGKIDWERVLVDGTFSPSSSRRPAGCPRLQGKGCALPSTQRRSRASFGCKNNSV